MVLLLCQTIKNAEHPPSRCPGPRVTGARFEFEGEKESCFFPSSHSFNLWSIATTLRTSITMHSPSFLSASTLLAILVSSGCADVVTVTISSTITTCYATPPPPPPCSTVIGVDSSAWSSLLSSGGSIIGGGGGGGGSGNGGGSGGSVVLPTYDTTGTLSRSSFPSLVSPTYTSGWNTTTYLNSTIAPTVTASSSSTISSSSTSSSAPACTDYWLENIQHQGLAPYAAAGYKVFRNVLDYGAKGDGLTDDTAAINLAISDGGRCAPGTCSSTTTTPAIVYFPPGTYLISSPIVDYYYTQLIGNPGCLPVIKASASFSARWVIDGDQVRHQPPTPLSQDLY